MMDTDEEMSSGGALRDGGAPHESCPRLHRTRLSHGLQGIFTNIFNDKANRQVFLNPNKHGRQPPGVLEPKQTWPPTARCSWTQTNMAANRQMVWSTRVMVWVLLPLSTSVSVKALEEDHRGSAAPPRSSSAARGEGSSLRKSVLRVCVDLWCSRVVQFFSLLTEASSNQSEPLFSLDVRKSFHGATETSWTSGVDLRTSLICWWRPEGERRWGVARKPSEEEPTMDVSEPPEHQEDPLQPAGPGPGPEPPCIEV